MQRIGSGTDYETYCLTSENMRLFVENPLKNDKIRITAVSDFLFSSQVILISREEAVELGNLLIKLGQK